MLTLLSEVKFLTSRDDINIKDTDYGAFKYQEKKASSTNNQPYAEAKHSYTELRGQPCSLDSKKSKKILGSLKKLEEQLKHNKIVYCAWSDNVVFQMLLSNGLLVHICINIFTGEIMRMAFDRFFIGKLVSESITGAIITRMHIILSYNENQLTFVYLQKPTMKRSAPEKISRMDPKIFNIIINGSQSRKIPRYLACNNSYDLVVVWTKSSQNEVYPWRPTVRDQDRANVHIYRLSRTKLELLCYYWTENDPINIEFSRMNQNQLRSVEQKISRKGDVTVEICVYDIIKSKIQRVAVTSIPLQTQVCCHAFSPDNEKLMLGCIDGSVVLFDEGRGITHLIKAAFIPTLVSWHADSAIVLIANERGQLQSFDISLACIKSQLISEDMTPSNVLDLSSYFSVQPTLLNICCSKKPDLALHGEKYVQTDSFVLLVFENGPMANLRLFGGSGLRGDIHTSGFTADVLIHQYLCLHNVERAINVLLCLNWDAYGAMCLISLNKIANYIFKQPLSLEREMQLEKALGSFHVPVKALCEETEIEFGDQVRDITRKFFQYLLRYKSYEKAFNLAIDIRDEDLFMDLSNCAKADGQIDLAEDAFRKAEEILARSDSQLSSHSTCSRSSCSECGDDSQASDEDDDSVHSENNNEPVTDVKKRDVKYGKQSVASAAINRRPEECVTPSTKSSNLHSLSSPTPTSSKTRFNIPKPELKVSSQPRSYKGRNYATKSHLPEMAPLIQHEHSDMPRMTSPLPMFAKSPSQIDLVRDFSAAASLYSSPTPLNASRSSTSVFPSSFSTDQIDHMTTNAVSHDIDYLKYQQQSVEMVQRPLPRVHQPSHQHQQQQQQQQQQHKVIDILPKPALRQSSAMEWRVPDQTLGIPVISPSSSLNHLHATNRPMFNYAPMHPSMMSMHATSGTPSTSTSSHTFNPKPISLLKSKSMFNIPNNTGMATVPSIPQVIHQHPLVSGHIPPTPHFIDSYTLKRNPTAPNVPGTSKISNRPMNMNVMAPSILSSPSSQPHQPPKKENGEKNKVKFSDTVTVAVVPEIPRKEKSILDRIKRTANGYHHQLVTDPQRELADSLPLCHPNDDYLKDFTPMSVREDQQAVPNSVQEGVLTWV